MKCYCLNASECFLQTILFTSCFTWFKWKNVFNWTVMNSSNPILVSAEENNKPLSESTSLCNPVSWQVVPNVFGLHLNKMLI